MFSLWFLYPRRPIADTHRCDKSSCEIHPSNDGDVVVPRQRVRWSIVHRAVCFHYSVKRRVRWSGVCCVSICLPIRRLAGGPLDRIQAHRGLASTWPITRDPLADHQPGHQPAAAVRRPCNTVRVLGALSTDHVNVPKTSKPASRPVALAQVGLQTAVLMRYHLSYLAVAALAVSIAVEQAAAVAQAGGGGGANWYLRTPDGSSQGPYGLSQLGEWSSSGYVSRGESVCESCTHM